MTPPKCATHALHAVFAREPFLSLSYCGLSRTEENRYDWHTHIFANETARHKKIVVVRNPYNRLVSLYAHHCMDCSGRGNMAPDFVGFVTAVTEKAYAPFYWMRLVDWLEGVKYDAFVRQESLVADLNREGLEVKEIPKDFCSHLRKPHYAFYDERTVEMANEWCLADCEAFGYSAPIQLLASLKE
jgi:hypothetical protein